MSRANDDAVELVDLERLLDSSIAMANHELPAAPPEAQVVTVKPQPRPRPTRRGRVMVIDDEETIARGVHRQLAGDHEVVALTSPNEALRRVRAGERYDAIVCDLIVPELTGMEVFAQLDTEAPDQARRMIFMTGGAFTERARQFLAENATRCLDKPLDRVQLTTAICRLVDGAPQGGSVAT